MEEKEIQALLTRYLSGDCNEEEIALVETVYLLDRKSYTAELSSQNITDDVNQVLETLPKPARRTTLMPVIAVAASLLVFLFAALYFFSAKDLPSAAQQSVAQNDVPPGKNRATLTLSNGKTIVLSSAKKGVVLTVEKMTYDDGTTIDEKNIISGYTLINTPSGGQYGITLSDGTKIMLNAATSIKFPSSFKGHVNRSIELNGEAYFEVTKDQKHPFIVKTANQTVEVLGTHFNISGYKDDAATRTTLMEGAVKVTSANKVEVKQLKPGQQAVSSGSEIQVEDVDAEDAIAWKNGYFMFDYESLEEVMAKLSRWYDIKVQYEDEAVKRTVFFGTISKFENISKVLRMLERTGVVKFEVKNRTLKIYKKKKMN